MLKLGSLFLVVWGIVLLGGCSPPSKKPKTNLKTFQDTAFVRHFHDQVVPDPFHWMEKQGSVSLQRWMDYRTRIAFSGILTVATDLKTPWAESNATFVFPPSPIVQKDGKTKYLTLYKTKENRAFDYFLADTIGKGSSLGTKLSTTHFPKGIQGVSSPDGNFFLFPLSKEQYRVLALTNSRYADTLQTVPGCEPVWANNGIYWVAPNQAGDKAFPVVQFKRIRISDKDSSRLVFADRSMAAQTIKLRASTSHLLLEQESSQGNRTWYRKKFMDTLASFTSMSTPPLASIVGMGQNTIYYTDSIPTRLWAQSLVSGPPVELLYTQKGKITQVTETPAGYVVVHSTHQGEGVQLYSRAGEWLMDVSAQSVCKVRQVTASATGNRVYALFSGLTIPDQLVEIDVEGKQQHILWQAEALPWSTGHPPVFETVEFPDDQGRAMGLFLAGYDLRNKDRQKTLIVLGHDSWQNPASFPLLRSWMNDGGLVAIPHLPDPKAVVPLPDYASTVLEYLRANGYCPNGKAYGIGWGWGGTALLASALQNPDSWQACVLADVPADWLALHDMQDWAWIPTLGNVKNIDDFAWQWLYSPYQQILKKKYPSMLLGNTWESALVHPAHMAKTAAALEGKQQNPDASIYFARDRADRFWNLARVFLNQQQ